MRTIVAVKFRKGESLTDREYTYYASEEFEVGEVVDVPVGKGHGSAVVTKVGMTIDDVPEHIRPFLKEIPPQVKMEVQEPAPEPFKTEEDEQVSLGLEDIV